VIKNNKKSEKNIIFELFTDLYLENMAFLTPGSESVFGSGFSNSNE
jgi:hypothetical protein